MFCTVSIKKKWFDLHILSGPKMQKPLIGSSMVETNGDLYLFGGDSNDYLGKTGIYKLSCASRECKWSAMNQALTIPRVYPIAIKISDNVQTTCS